MKLFTYLRYFHAVGWGLSLSILLGYIGQAASFVGFNLWLSDWTTDALRYENKTYPVTERDMRVGIYGVLGASNSKFPQTLTPCYYPFPAPSSDWKKQSGGTENYHKQQKKAIPSSA